MPLQQSETINISTDGSTQNRTITLEWMPRSADAIFLLMEPFDDRATRKPTVVWLTRQTPRVAGIPLPLANALFKAYGLEVWRDLNNLKVQSSCETEWNSQEAAASSLHLGPHQETRSVLDCFEPFDPFPCTVPMLGSYVEGLPTAGMSTSTQGLLLCRQQRHQDQSFQEWVLLRGQPLRSLPQHNLQALLPSRRRVSIRLLALRPQPAQLLLLASASSIIDVHMHTSRDELQLELPRQPASLPEVIYARTYMSRDEPQPDQPRQPASAPRVINARTHMSRDEPQLDLPIQPAFVPRTMNARTHLSRAELQKLMDKALAFRRGRGYHGQKILLTHFFRNRWTDYFNDIFNNKGGLMETYLKDANGDPKSAINGNIFGLFFSVALDTRTHRPPTESYFGEKRLFVAAHILFRENSRLYFADFYCHYLKAHYVTLVMTTRDSQTDRFCEKYLIELDIRDNPFLTRDPSSVPAKVYTTLCDKMHIEVYYTEHVHITRLQQQYGRDQVYMTDCATLGRGRSIPQGIPKNSSCPTCNLSSSSLYHSFSNWHI